MPFTSEKLPRLQELVLELTSMCPLTCKHCSSNSGPKRDESLTEELAMRVLGQAIDCGASQISYGGGEPTVHPSLVSVVRLAAKAKLLNEIFTCGVILKHKKASPLPLSLLNDLADTGLVKLVFSIHGANEHTHDTITGVPGSFRLFNISVERAVALGIKTEFNFVPMKTNFRDFRKVVKLAIGQSIKKLSLLRFVSQGRGLENQQLLELSREEEISFLGEVQDLRKFGAIEIRTGSPYNDCIQGNRIPCRAGAQKLVIQADGNVLPCEVYKHIDRKEWHLSVFENTLFEILNDKKLESLRHKIGQSEKFHCPVHHAFS